MSIIYSKLREMFTDALEAASKEVFAMPFGAGRVVCGGAAELAVYIGTFTFSECITR